MSLVHHVRVGFFGTPQEPSSPRQLGAEECEQLLRLYNECAPEDVRVQIEPVTSGTTSRGIVLGSVDGFPFVLKNGVLICPYLATAYLAGAICFVAFLHKTIGCSIYSDDEGRFLSLEEFVPQESLSTVMQAVMQQGTSVAAQPLASPDPARL
jgi:hypothetical protein